ncbi:MAG: ROK family protein [Cytophagales bacterium]|nr:ROK family protein [Cytophagales bacterium]
MLWGIDLGGTKIEGVVLKSAENPEVLARMRIPTEQEHGYEHILSQISKLIGMMSKEVGARPEKIGIGTPGTLDPQAQTLKNSNTTCYNGRPFITDLEQIIKMPISIANDANCFALAEAKMGAVKSQKIDAEVVFGVIMGTGVGGGLIVNGKIIGGKHGIGGEWGHNFLDESGGECYCGKIGCVETVISGPFTQRYYESLSGQKKHLKEIVELHKAGTDPNATKTINRLTHFFGKAISVVIDIVDPDVVVIGGGVGNVDYLYTDGVQSAREFVFNDGLETTFLKPELGDSAGVFGAAMLVAD